MTSSFVSNVCLSTYTERSIPSIAVSIAVSVSDFVYTLFAFAFSLNAVSTCVLVYVSVLSAFAPSAVFNALSPSILAAIS